MRMVKSRNVTLVGHIARVKETALAHKIVVEKGEGKIPF
jgi:hypothetical protein